MSKLIMVEQFKTSDMAKEGVSANTPTVRGKVYYYVLEK